MEDQPDVSLHPPTVFLSAFLIGFLLRVFSGAWLFLPPVIAEALGGLLLLGAIIIVVLAISEFSETGETLRPASPSHQLLTKGVFRYSRNPIYLAMTLLGIGFGFATGNLWMILSSFAAAAVINYFVIPEEEAYLFRRFGAEYDHYRKQTRRWI